MIGNYMFECDALNEANTQNTTGNDSDDHHSEMAGNDNLIVGFENHSGQTFLGDGIRPIGRVLAGYGNTEKADYEGMHYKNVFGAYCHGPMLPKNPRFCDLLLQTALDRKYGKGTVMLTELDDTLENNAHDYMVRRLSK
jgi:CobQ-like glutamine amidotransferase family enzyme